jgi:hypothetical protein
LNYRDAEYAVSRLKEINQKPPRHVPDHEELENITLQARAEGINNKTQTEACEEKDFVKLRWMARNPVTKIYSPGQSCGVAICVIRQTSQKTTDSANCNSQNQRNYKEVSSRRANLQARFCQLDRNQATG